MTEATAKLDVAGTALDLKVRKGSVGPDVIDIGQLYAKTGAFTTIRASPRRRAANPRSPISTVTKAFSCTAASRSISLRNTATSSRSCYLLLYGELPTKTQKDDFDYRITRHTMVHEQMSRFFTGFRRGRASDGRDVRRRRGTLGLLPRLHRHFRSVPADGRLDAAHRQDADDRRHGVQVPYRSAVRLPKNELSFAANFLHMCFAVPCEEYKVNPVLARAMDRIFILHADHEQNASTSTVRLAGSSGANPFACMLPASPASGAPHMAVRTKRRSTCSAKSARSTESRNSLRAPRTRTTRSVSWASATASTKHDPRAKIMQKTTHEVLGELGIKDDPLLDVAMELEKIALTDEYFIEKKLYPNIDFYSGITLKALGFPTTMFTVLFAVARTVGWIAQWKEMIEDPHQKIGRPRQLYTGEPLRDYVPIAKR